MVFGRCLFSSAVRCLSPSTKFHNATSSLIARESLFSTVTLDKSDSSSSSVITDMSKKNRLSLEKSSYLLQHANNPVDWYPWCQEAFEKAKNEDKLIFLSVGYSTCHWCHVMEHESFEDEKIAKIMNKFFVNIKVDREERPDIDKIYMTFIQNISGHGGWPMSVFLTPDLLPIMGGTYFPPTDKYGQPSFESVLLSVAKSWLDNKDKILTSGTKILKVLKISCENKNDDNNDDSNVDKLTDDIGKKCVQQLINSYDEEYGGFSNMPKFPQPVNLNILFYMYSRNPNDELSKQCLEMCLNTLNKMSNGGIHDHIGQGFSRYSVDEKWHVPHFEKMLYDQAQLLRSYAMGYVVTNDDYYKNIVDDIVTYVTRELRHNEGGFYSAEDADSLPTYNSKKKTEGAYYVWTNDEIKSLLNKKIEGIKKASTLSDIFSYHFNIKSNGNLMKYQDPHGELDGKNVLIITESIEKTAEYFSCSIDTIKEHLEEARLILFEERCKRPRPHLDDKIVTAWNGLMISGLAFAGTSTNNKKYIEYAKETAQFIEKYLYDKEKKILLRSCYRSEGNIITQSSVPIKGFHADYAFTVQGLLDLYEATTDIHWLELAEELNSTQDELFIDSECGGYFATVKDEKNIILRLKDEHDGAEPSSNSVACNNLLRLNSLLDCKDNSIKVNKLFKYFYDTLERIPVAVPELVCALLHYRDATIQFYIIGKRDGDDTQELLNVIRSRLIPAKVVIVIDPDEDNTFLCERNPILCKMKAQKGRATVYVCRHRACSLPVVKPEELAELIDSP
ncbi:hypothetical protein HCN44_011379 [Aphidius gifuensis]|uniref:Spermatogenesis-associated protein 20-like TRX domain-containing protein n=1 Tax=Aphidius gifuensis TaxID=684658 RepID=A0A834XVB7_APHGI|nr:hypothetical protein HCN44_011379 [Aphidius gifuensis]